MISIVVDSREPVRALTLLSSHLADSRDPLAAVLERGLEDSRLNLATRGGDAGVWEPMSPWTEIVARKLYGKARSDGSLLEDTGALLASLYRGAPGNIFEVSASEGVAGTELADSRTGYGIGSLMEKGTTRTFHVLQGEGYTVPGIPPRPFMAPPEAHGDEYVGIFADEVWAGVDDGKEA